MVSAFRLGRAEKAEDEEESKEQAANRRQGEPSSLVSRMGHPLLSFFSFAGQDGGETVGDEARRRGG